MLIYEDFVSKHYDALYNEDTVLSDLPNEALDEAVYIWLTSHKTWFEDIYPPCFTISLGRLATDMLFGKTQVSNRVASGLFVAIVDSLEEYDRDYAWWSEALERHLDEIAYSSNFADEMREIIYLYLEPTIESAIYDEFYKQKREQDMDHGVYNSEVRGNC